MVPALRDLYHRLRLVVQASNYRLRRWADPVAAARWLGVSVGSDCRLIDVEFGSDPYLVRLGDHVSATRTTFITHDGGVWVFRNEEPDIDVVAPIHVGNNVFLGAGSVVMPGVQIGDNVVIAAGAIVTHSVESGSVMAGVPARRIKSIDEYRLGIEKRTMPTKSLSAKEKRSLLEQHFFG